MYIPTLIPIHYGVPTSFTQSFWGLTKAGSIEATENRVTRLNTLGYRARTEYGFELLSDFYLKEKQKPAIEKIFQKHLDPNFLDALRRLSPITNIRIDPSYAYQTTAEGFMLDGLYLQFEIHGKWYRWEKLSDGARRMVYMLHVLELASLVSSCYLIDEPELGIDPHLFFYLMEYFKEKAETNQVIIATHDVQALDILKYHELDVIHIVKQTPEEGTQVKPLTPAQIEHAKEYLEEEGLYLRDYWIHVGFNQEEKPCTHTM